MGRTGANFVIVSSSGVIEACWVGWARPLPQLPLAAPAQPPSHVRRLVSPTHVGSTTPKAQCPAHHHSAPAHAPELPV